MAYNNYKSLEDFDLRFELEAITHVLNRHMNKSDEYLMNRKVDVASTFVCDSATDLWLLIKNTVLDEENVEGSFIREWIEDDSDYEDYICQNTQLPESISGRGYEKDGKKFVDYNEFVVILRKSEKTGRFYLANAFPCPDGYNPYIK